MMMIVDCNKASKPIYELSDDLDKLGEKIGVSIKCNMKIFLTACTEFNRRVL